MTVADAHRDHGGAAEQRRRPGPRRPEGSPSGRDAVRDAVIEAAGHLFALRGVDGVSLRDVAAAADVQLSLIGRYVGNRQALIEAVFSDLTVRLARDVVERPLQQMGFERESVMGRWTVIVMYFALTRAALPLPEAAFNPVEALAEVIQREYGLDSEAARLRGAQIVASAIGWRVCEDFVISWGGLASLERQVLRDELTAMHRRLGATPWPSPDPERTGN